MANIDITKTLEKMGEPSSIRFAAVYLDLDGTLLNSRGEVLPSTRDALESYRRCGGRFGLATGRTLEETRPYLAQFGGPLRPDLPIILENGRRVVSPASLQSLSFGGPRTSKSKAIQRLLSQYRLTTDDVVIIGGTASDAGVMGDFPVSLAMANGHPQTIGAAGSVIGRNDEPAIARAFERLIMGRGCRDRITREKRQWLPDRKR